MQQVRELGYLPRERSATEQSLAKALRTAQAAGFMAAYESELENLAFALLLQQPRALLQSMFNAHSE